MLSLRLASSHLLKRGYSSAASHQISDFDLKWKAMSEPERDVITKEYEQIQAGDWRKLTLEQKQQLYTIAYGTKVIQDNSETKTIIWSVAGLIGVAMGVFGLIRYFAQPPPSTLSKEYQEATLQYMKDNNMNPIFGISSKKD